MELNGLAVKLQAECKPETCTQMTATEQWIFLCAAHKTPKECPAIDYTRHTLDGAACLLNSNKYFPSRYDCYFQNQRAYLQQCNIVSLFYVFKFNTILVFRVSIKESSVAKLGSVCRRVYRIFSHAYFHHRAIFDAFEKETHLCKRFTYFVTKYSIISKEILILPKLDDETPVGESEA